jgi:hypothetical protein
MGFESLNMGSLESGGECGIAHIGGAKTIHQIALCAQISGHCGKMSFVSRAARSENAP